MAKIEDIKGSNDIFKVPEDYFEGISSEIDIRIFEEGLKEKYGTNTPYRVPNGYLESIDPEFFQSKKLSIIQILKPYISIAAGIILIAGIWQIVAVNFEKKGLTNAVQDTLNGTENVYAEFVVDLSKIDTTEIEAKAESYLYEMDNESVYIISESESKIESENNKQDESIYDYFVDYDAGMDYIDFLAEQ